MMQSVSRVPLVSSFHGSVRSSPGRKSRPRVALHSVTDEVLLPCGKAVCWAPLRALVVMAGMLGFRNRGPKPRTAPLSTATIKVTPVKKQGIEGVPEIMEQLMNQLAEATAAFAAAAEEAFRVASGAKAANPSGLDASEIKPCGRAFLKPGSWYQNEYMSLWNNSDAPVSSSLHIKALDEFELKVMQLDSKNGGSDGWVIFRSSFDIEPVQGNPRRMRLHLRHNEDLQILEYDEALFDRGANFMLGVLRRATCLLMGAFSLEVDIEEQVVYCGPRAGIVQKFWQSSVGLALTEQEKLWSFDTSAAKCATLADSTATDSSSDAFGFQALAAA